MKQKMSNLKFRAIVIPVVATAFSLCQIATIGMTMFSTVMDDYLGRGEMSIQKVPGSENWDTDYYKNPYKNRNESKEASYQIAQKVQEEGIVLLKNNGVLPLNKGAEVTPFGYRAIDPIYGQVSSSGSAKWTVKPVTPEEGLKSAFTVNSSAMDAMKKAGNPEAVVLSVLGGVLYLLLVSFLPFKFVPMIPAILYTAAFGYALQATLPPLSDVWNGVHFIGGFAYMGLFYTIRFFVCAVASIVSCFFSYYKPKKQKA